MRRAVDMVNFGTLNGKVSVSVFWTNLDSKWNPEESIAIVDHLFRVGFTTFAKVDVDCFHNPQGFIIFTRRGNMKPTRREFDRTVKAAVLKAKERETEAFNLSREAGNDGSWHYCDLEDF